MKSETGHETASVSEYSGRLASSADQRSCEKERNLKEGMEMHTVGKSLFAIHK